MVTYGLHLCVKYDKIESYVIVSLTLKMNLCGYHIYKELGKSIAKPMTFLGGELFKVFFYCNCHFTYSSNRVGLDESIFI